MVPSTPLCEEIRAIVSSISATVDGSTVSGPALITTVYKWMRRRGMVMAMAVHLIISATRKSGIIRVSVRPMQESGLVRW